MAIEHSGSAFGIDIGGTGIKGAVVDLATGDLLTERLRFDTPQPATPEAVCEVAAKIVAEHKYTGAIGVDYPGVVQNGVVQTAANVDKSWIGANLVEEMSKKVSGKITALNDADAAGLAEVRYGAGRGHSGVVIMVTFGTGIGTAIIHNEQLIPNAELGHIEVDGHDAERKAAASAREREDLSWEQWAKRASKYLQTLENLLWPELFIFGGGISKKPEKWMPLIKMRTPAVIANLINNAGIVGSALAAHEASLAD